jgi:hypothetical protein
MPWTFGFFFWYWFWICPSCSVRVSALAACEALACTGNGDGMRHLCLTGAIVPTARMCGDDT